MTVMFEMRQQAILKLLNDGGHVTVAELARRFKVSEMTIRRDLQQLEDTKLAVRVHGGALAGEKSRFVNRIATNYRAKVRAVSKFIPCLPREGCIFFDGSTTVLNLVRHLKGMDRLQVATNNMETFKRLIAVRGPSPILIGGSLDFRTDNMVGPMALRSVETLVFEKAFFSSWGLNAESGLNEATMDDAEVKLQVARRSQANYVAMVHSKFGIAAGGTWSPGPDKTTMSTDLDPGDERLKPFEAMFSRII